MKKKEIKFSKRELKILEEYKKVSKLKQYRITYLTQSIPNFLLTISSVINVINWLQRDNVVLLTIWIIMLLASSFLFISKFSHVYTLNRLLKKCKNADNNCFVYICKLKINKCKELIANQENKLAVDYYFNKLNDFLNEYKDYIPHSTYSSEIDYIKNYLYSNDI